MDKPQLGRTSNVDIMEHFYDVFKMFSVIGVENTIK